MYSEPRGYGLRPLPVLHSTHWGKGGYSYSVDAHQGLWQKNLPNWRKMSAHGNYGRSVMFRKTLLATFTTAAVAVGATSSTIAPASADIGLFFNLGQPYYGAYYYGLYPFTTGSDYYSPYYFAPGAPYEVYHYHPPYHSSYSYGDPVASCAARFHTYNPVTHTYIGKNGIPHHCP